MRRAVAAAFVALFTSALRPPARTSVHRAASLSADGRRAKRRSRREGPMLPGGVEKEASNDRISFEPAPQNRAAKRTAAALSIIAAPPMPGRTKREEANKRKGAVVVPVEVSDAPQKKEDALTIAAKRIAASLRQGGNVNKKKQKAADVPMEEVKKSAQDSSPWARPEKEKAPPPQKAAVVPKEAKKPAVVPVTASKEAKKSAQNEALKSAWSTRPEEQEQEEEQEEKAPPPPPKAQEDEALKPAARPEEAPPPPPKVASRISAEEASPQPVMAPVSSTQAPLANAASPARVVVAEKKSPAAADLKDESVLVTLARETMERIYSEHNPEKLGEIDFLLAKYKGKEALLVAALEAKYTGTQRVRLLRDETAAAEARTGLQKEALFDKEAKAAANAAFEQSVEELKSATSAFVKGEKSSDVEASRDVEEAARLVLARCDPSSRLQCRALAAAFGGAVARLRLRLGDTTTPRLLLEMTPSSEMRWRRADEDDAVAELGGWTGVGAAYAAATRDATSKSSLITSTSSLEAALLVSSMEEALATILGAYETVDRRELDLWLTDYWLPQQDLTESEGLVPLLNELLRRCDAVSGMALLKAMRRSAITPDAETSEVANLARVFSAKRFADADAMKHLPEPGPPEIVLLGRSNVGKSSLANSLLGRKMLAPTSPVPGKTRRFVYYAVNDKQHALKAHPKFWLVDVPGAGFAVENPHEITTIADAAASFSTSKVESWRSLTARYLEVRSTLKIVLQLLDCRRVLDSEAFPKPDRELMELVANSAACTERGARHVIALTKVDKLKNSQNPKTLLLAKTKVLEYYARNFPENEPPKVLITAATLKPPIGRDDLWEEILTQLL